MNLNLSINKPEAEEADGDVNETKDEIDHCWGGDDDNEGEGDIENKYSKDAAYFFQERGRLYTPLTMMLMMMMMMIVMMMITRMAKTIMMCQY